MRYTYQEKALPPRSRAFAADIAERRPAPDILARRMVRLIERRFGASVLPYDIRQVGISAWRIRDRETRSWVEAQWRGGRLYVTAEHDGA